MSKKIIVFAVILIFAVLAVVCYWKVPGMQEKVAALIEEDFSEENIYSDLEGLSERLDAEILEGHEAFTIYLKDMDVDEINQINSSLNGIFGSGATYQQVGKIGDTYKKVTITMNRTTNYYALQAYVKNEPIPEEEKKAEELYRVIKEIMDNQISSDMSDYEKELALHDYLVTHCTYTKEAEQSEDSDIYRAYGALVNHDAVCNGYAEAMQILLMCAGINTKFVIGTTGDMDHAWNLVEINEKWYHLDATWNDPLPDQGEDALHTYFNVTDEILGISHTWEREKYPKATDMSNNYYKKSQAYFKSFDEYKMKAYDLMVCRGERRFEAAIENYSEKEDDMQFIFKDNAQYDSVTWQTFQEGSYSVLVLKAE